MASAMSHRLLLSLSILLGLLTIAAKARPCKTLLISSYTFSFSSQNPNFGDQNPNDPSSTRFITFFTEIRQVNPRPAYIFGSDFLIDRPRPFMPDELHLERPIEPFRSSSAFNSLRDRTKDLLSVVAALLFGVGCGALTAATMYFVWSLFSNRYDFSYDHFDDDDEDDVDDVSPKKMGYVKVPAAPVASSVPAPAKEVV